MEKEKNVKQDVIKERLTFAQQVVQQAVVSKSKNMSIDCVDEHNNFDYGDSKSTWTGCCDIDNNNDSDYGDSTGCWC